MHLNFRHTLGKDFCAADHKMEGEITRDARGSLTECWELFTIYSLVAAGPVSRIRRIMLKVRKLLNRSPREVSIT